MNNTRRTQVEVGGGWRLVNRRDAISAGVPAESLKPVKFATPFEMLDDQIWVRVQLDDEWIAAYRVVSQDGYPVIGELRVFPAEPGPRPNAGTWRSGEFLRMNAKAPPGGLSARLVHSIRVGEHVADMGKILDRFSTLGIGLEPYSLTATKRPRPKPSRRGRKGHPDLFLAEIARDYVAACSAPGGSRRPTSDVAERRKLSRERVRDLLSKARARDLLTKVKHGRGGGQLTAKAQAVLAETVPKIVPASTRKQPTTTHRHPTKKKKTPR